MSLRVARPTPAPPSTGTSPASPSSESPPAPPRSEASPGRRAVQVTVAVAGWVLFVWWWWIVINRVSRAEITFTLVFVAISLVVVVGITLSWIMHNLGIFKRKGSRLSNRQVPENFERDVLDRTLTFEGGLKEARTAQVVGVRVDDGAKVFSPRRTIASGGGADADHDAKAAS